MITVSEYKKCVDDGICSEPTCYANNNAWRQSVVFYFNSDLNSDEIPMNCMTWEQANQYCKWINKRLPTEAEWEYAAAANYNSAYTWGNDFKGISCVDEYNTTIDCPIIFERGQVFFDRSFFNVFDLMGNVKEWTQDWYHPNYYTYSEYENPRGPKNGTQKVIRGGSIHNILHGDYYSGQTTIFSREASLPDYVDKISSIDYGFRCARDYK